MVRAPHRPQHLSELEVLSRPLAKIRHANWSKAHGEEIRHELNFCPSYLQLGFCDTAGVVRTGSG